MLLTCATVVLVITYVLAVQTAGGQSLENAALRGADQVSDPDSDQAWKSLGQITVWSLAVGTVLIGLIGVLRKKYLLAAVAVGTIVGGQVVTQSLKRFILPRPELVPVTGDFVQNSFPSGHTTIAMTALVAVLLVVPFRYRGLAMFVVMTWAIGIGAYTVTAKWHRFSDTLGGDMVALMMGAIAALILHRAGRISRVDRAPKLRVVYVVLMAFGAAVLLALGVLLVVGSLAYTLQDPVIEWNLYLAAHSLAMACSVLAGLVYWASWRKLEVA
ncbi:phosphatase PAP2 family protein [Leucobacter sp. VD1]|uniref:phosphatase PAP2 family protein n=1 Tax=Leucobacter sp. VD1 TaxID=3080381 RepID=UPI0030187B44